MSVDAHPPTDALTGESIFTPSTWFRQFDRNPLVCNSPLFCFHIMKNAIKALDIPFSLVPSTTNSAEIQLDISAECTKPLVIKEAFFDKAVVSAARQLRYPHLAANTETKIDFLNNKEMETTGDVLDHMQQDWVTKTLQAIKTTTKGKHICLSIYVKKVQPVFVFSVLSIYMKPEFRIRTMIGLIQRLPDNVFKSTDELPDLLCVFLSGTAPNLVRKYIPFWPRDGGLFAYAPSGVWFGIFGESARLRSKVDLAQAKSLDEDGLFLALYLHFYQRLAEMGTDIQYIDGLLYSALHATIVRKASSNSSNNNEIKNSAAVLKLHFNPRDLSHVQQANCRIYDKLGGEIYTMCCFMNNVARDAMLPVDFLECIKTGLAYDTDNRETKRQSPRINPVHATWARKIRKDVDSPDWIRKKLGMDHDNSQETKRFNDFLDGFVKSNKANAGTTTGSANLSMFWLDDCTSGAVQETFTETFTVQTLLANPVFSAQFIERTGPSACSTQTIVCMPTDIYSVYIRWANYQLLWQQPQQQQPLHRTESIVRFPFAPILCQLLCMERTDMVLSILRDWCGLTKVPLLQMNPGINTRTDADQPIAIVSPSGVLDGIVDIIFLRYLVEARPTTAAQVLPYLLCFHTDSAPGDAIRMTQKELSRCIRMEEEADGDLLALYGASYTVTEVDIYNIYTSVIKTRGNQENNNLWPAFYKAATEIFSLWSMELSVGVKDVKPEEADVYFDRLIRLCSGFEYRDAKGRWRGLRNIKKVPEWKDVPSESMYRRTKVHYQTRMGKVTRIPIISPLSSRDEIKEINRNALGWWQFFAVVEQCYEQLESQADTVDVKSPVDALYFIPEDAMPFPSKVFKRPLTLDLWDVPLAMSQTINGPVCYFADQHFPLRVNFPVNNPQLQTSDRFRSMRNEFVCKVLPEHCRAIMSRLQWQLTESKAAPKAPPPISPIPAIVMPSSLSVTNGQEPMADAKQTPHPKPQGKKRKPQDDAENHNDKENIATADSSSQYVHPSSVNPLKKVKLTPGNTVITTTEEQETIRRRIVTTSSSTV